MVDVTSATESDSAHHHPDRLQEPAVHTAPALPDIRARHRQTSNYRTGIMAKATMFDITNETHPIPVSMWRCQSAASRQGRPLRTHQRGTGQRPPNRHENRIAWLAYFNAGVRVIDVSDPYAMKELGYFSPKPNKNSHPMGAGQKTAIQTNDVTIDHRGLAYTTDRVGTGMFVLEYTGPKPVVDNGTPIPAPPAPTPAPTQ
jgi:hypothetical protein